MNRRLIVFAMLSLLSVKPALAQSVPSEGSGQAVEDNARLERVRSLLQALDQEKALSMNASGEVMLKNSLRQQLQNQGRLKSTTAKAGVVCD